MRGRVMENKNLALHEKFKEIFNLSWKREVTYLLILPCINCRNNDIVICF